MTLSGHHETTLRKLFAHPVSHNIEVRDVRSLLDALGAIARESEDRITVSLGGVTTQVDLSHHHHENALSEDEVVALRRLLTAAGVTPGSPA